MPYNSCLHSQPSCLSQSDYSRIYHITKYCKETLHAKLSIRQLPSTSNAKIRDGAYNRVNQRPLTSTRLPPTWASTYPATQKKTKMIPMNSIIHYYTTNIKKSPYYNHPLTFHPTTPQTNPSLILIDPNLRRLELSRRNLSLKQNIRLAIRPMLQFRQSKVRSNPHHQCRASPDIPALAGQVPPCGIQHPRRQINHRDFGDVVRGPSDSCTQRAESHRRGLGNDSV